MVFSIELFREYLKHFVHNAKAYYGSPPLCYLRYLFYSFLRVNKFHLFRKDLKSEGGFLMTNPYYISKMHIHDLQHLRAGRKLPMEFHCDITFGFNSCFVATCNQEPAFIAWVCESSAKSRFFRLGPSVAEVNYLTTIPEFRGNGLAWKSLKYAGSFLRDQGFTTLVAAVHNNNIACIKSMERAGFSRIGHTWSIGRLNRKKLFI